MFPIAQAHIDRVVLVFDHAIRMAQKMLWEARGWSPNQAAAPRSRRFCRVAYLPAANERVGVVVSGANTTAVSFE